MLQSVADSQPDVDAIFRLTRKTPFSFRRPTCIKKGCIDWKIKKVHRDFYIFVHCNLLITGAGINGLRGSTLKVPDSVMTPYNAQVYDIVIVT